MTLNGAITELVLLSEHPMMPVIFKPGIQKVIETISELEAQPEQRTDLLKAEIKRMKRSFTICINRDYYTGYMSALSAVEGYIAKMTEGDAE